MTASQSTEATGLLLSLVHKSLGVPERNELGSIRSVFYHCHEWLRGRDANHHFSYKSIDCDRQNFQALGILPECVIRYYEEVVRPTIKSAA